MERAWRQGVEPLRCRAYRLEGKAHYRVIAGVNHHLVPEMMDVMYQITHSGVIVKYQSRELLRKLILLDLFGEEDSWIMVVGARWSSSLTSPICF